MTKKECLKICLRLWKWLAETGSAEKSEWPEWKMNGGTIPAMNAYCPCCEYVGEDALDCSECPLLGYAWQADDSDDYCLADYKSLYRMWRFTTSTTTDRMNSASKMVSAIERALEDLK